MTAKLRVVQDTDSALRNLLRDRDELEREIVCELCQAPMTRRAWEKPNEHARRRFCSRTCANKSRQGTSCECSVEGCSRQAGTKRKGMCGPHYHRARRHGDPTAGGPWHGAIDEWVKKHIDYAGDECLKWPFGTGTKGYGVIQTGGTTTSASRAMCALAQGEAPDHSFEAAHSCGNGHLGCVNPKHLRWATRKENQADRRLHGTYTCGERHSVAKLTEKQVLAIRADNRSQTQIARDYGVAQTLISAIHRRKLWRHV